jgi:hypothetical protein
MEWKAMDSNEGVVLQYQIVKSWCLCKCPMNSKKGEKKRRTGCA